MARIMLTIETDERDALIELARREKRDARAQGAMLLRESLERRGLLPSSDLPFLTPTTSTTKGGCDDATR